MFLFRCSRCQWFSDLLICRARRCSVARDQSLPDVNCFVVSSALNAINAPKYSGVKKTHFDLFLLLIKFLLCVNSLKHHSQAKVFLFLALFQRDGNDAHKALTTNESSGGIKSLAFWVKSRCACNTSFIDISEERRTSRRAKEWSSVVLQRMKIGGKWEILLTALVIVRKRAVI